MLIHAHDGKAEWITVAHKGFLYSPPPLSSLLKLKHLCPRGLSVPALSSWLHPSPSCNHSSLSSLPVSFSLAPLIWSGESQSLLLRLGETPAAVECFDALWFGGGGADTRGVVPFTPGAANVLLFVETFQLFLLFGTIWCSFRGAQSFKTIAHYRVIKHSVDSQSACTTCVILSFCTLMIEERDHVTKDISHNASRDHRMWLATLPERVLFNIHVLCCWCRWDSFICLMLGIVTASCDWRQIHWNYRQLLNMQMIKH